MIILPRFLFFFEELCSDLLLGRRRVLAKLLPGVRESLRCPLCGGRLTILEYHSRLFYDVEHDRMVVYYFPRLICHGESCPHYDHHVRSSRRDKQGRPVPVGATHMVFPGFICPYVRISSKYVTLLAKAQKALDDGGCLSYPDSLEFKRFERHDGELKKVKSLCGALWDFLKPRLNSNSGRFYSAYFKWLCDKSEVVIRDYALDHYYEKNPGVVNGYLRIEPPKLSPCLHSASKLLRLLLCGCVQRRPPYTVWPPPLFYGELRSYRNSVEQKECKT